jgi:hypothetical protein
MGYEIKNCFLCDSNSKQSDTDHGNRVFVTCSNLDCGKYEITKSLIGETSGNEVLRNELQQQVKERSAGNGHLDFMRDFQGNLKSTWVART